MNRREALTHIAWILGGTLSPQWALHAHTHVAGDRSTSEIRTLNARQRAFIRAICDVIIPQTTTPAASAASVDAFIDMMLTDWYSDRERLLFLSGIDRLDRQCVESRGKPLAELDPRGQFEFVDHLDAEMVAARAAGSGELPVFAVIKELALIGYYTSEVGLTQELESVGPVGVADFGPAGPPSALPRY